MEVIGGLLNVAEFTRLPRPAGGVRQELHHGQLVELPPVKKLHTKLQKRLLHLLEAALNPAEKGVDKEFPFRPAPEYEVWVADVGVFGLALWDQTADDDYFNGVPDIVIEVMSPSNSASEMLEREEICLQHGGQEFWIVDPNRTSVKVVRCGGKSTIYDAASVIDSGVLEKSISVSGIFS